MNLVLRAFVLFIVTCSISTQADDRPAEVRSVFKISPKTVLEMRKAGQNHEAALYREIRNITEESDQVEIYLSPEEKTHHLNLLERAPTAISFVDATGAPWPIKTAKGYDGELFGVVKVENSFQNSAILNGKLARGSSYLTVFLEKLAEPIILKVNGSQSSYHKSRSFKIMKVGPLTEFNHKTAGIAEQIGLPADVDLNNVLFGVTPFGAKKLATNNSAVLAWEKGEHVLIRTNLDVFTPSHLRIKPGTNGYTAYRFSKTTLLYASNEAGKTVKIRIGDGVK